MTAAALLPDRRRPATPLTVVLSQEYLKDHLRNQPDLHEHANLAALEYSTKHGELAADQVQQMPSLLSASQSQRAVPFVPIRDDGRQCNTCWKVFEDADQLYWHFKNHCRPGNPKALSRAAPAIKWQKVGHGFAVRDRVDDVVAPAWPLEASALVGVHREKMDRFRQVAAPA